MRHFILTYKIGRKLTGIAGVEAEHKNAAFKLFLTAGYPNPNHHNKYDVAWPDVETNKNYIGRSPLYKEL